MGENEDLDVLTVAIPQGQFYAIVDFHTTAGCSAIMPSILAGKAYL